MSILLNKSVHGKTGTIYLPFESYMFLKAETQRQRSEHHPEISDFHRKELTNAFNRLSKNGMYEAHDGTFGGCNGSPINAWAEGRWIDWSVNEMAKMLDEQGLPYKMGEPVEVIFI